MESAFGIEHGDISKGIGIKNAWKAGSKVRAASSVNRGYYQTLKNSGKSSGEALSSVKSTSHYQNTAKDAKKAFSGGNVADKATMAVSRFRTPLAVGGAGAAVTGGAYAAGKKKNKRMRLARTGKVTT